MTIDILTIFPEMFDSVLSASIIGRARSSGLLTVEATDIRPFSLSKHKNTDDYPFGGGAGMLMMAQPIADAMKAICARRGLACIDNLSGQDVLADNEATDKQILEPFSSTLGEQGKPDIVGRECGGKGEKQSKVGGAKLREFGLFLGDCTDDMSSSSAFDDADAYVSSSDASVCTFSSNLDNHTQTVTDDLLNRAEATADGPCSANEDQEDNCLNAAFLSGDDVQGRITRPRAKRIYLSPRGVPLTQKLAQTLSQEQSLILLCGHYEGVDQRVLDKYVDLEVSVGDYVLTGGEVAAMVLVDCVARLVPGVLGSEESPQDESFSDAGLLEYPQYTRPRVFEGMEVPDVLLNGDHAKIAAWRRQQSIAATAARRPELLRQAKLTPKEKKEFGLE